ncbi:cadherin-like domain-containing protein [Flexibacterium corallicola]|uniref:cadherin-like domain-containing protein n=1 Tax=Flexibacterium corallicola TaxID=3037259 RepID=UPI00286ED65D|nr:cadherin-like domain-containing protein [Pseudovibrio sp. M1P-2-3]
MAKVNGNNNNNLIITGDSDDQVYGNGGNDYIETKGGDDYIHGGGNDDTIKAGDGEDEIWGGNGSDLIYGNKGDDLVYGGNGNDNIYGGKGNDTIDGGAKDDTINGGNGADTIIGGSGNDIINAGNGNDTVIHDEESNLTSTDVYSGGSGTDTLRLIVSSSTFYSTLFQSELANFESTLSAMGSVSGTFSSLGVQFDSFENIVIETTGNTAPTATSVDLGSVNEDGSRLIRAQDLLVGANDGDSDTLTLTSLSIQFGSGILTNNQDGTWTYNPAENDDRGVTFSYTVSDGALQASSTATLDITPVNDAPEANSVDLGSSEGDGTRIIAASELLAGAFDVDGDTLSVSDVSILSGAGTLSDNPDGTWSYVSDGNQGETVTFSYTVTDGELTDTSTADLEILAQNSPVEGEVEVAGFAIAGPSGQSGTHHGAATLFADTSRLIDSNGLGAFSYQWQQSLDNGSSWSSLANGDGINLTLQPSSVGSLVRVNVTHTDGNGFAETLTSAASEVVEQIDTGELHSEFGFVIQGGEAGISSGYDVSGAGDINNDGYDDIIIGSNQGFDSAPEAYVVFGGADGFGTSDASGQDVIDLGSLSPSDGFIIRGEQNYYDLFLDDFMSGTTVSAAGDLNGDNIDDLLFAVSGVGNAQNGTIYALYGSESTFGTTAGDGRQVVDASTFNGSSGFKMKGASGEFAGIDISDAGDMNGDGVDDVIIGTGIPGTGNTKVYVVYGDTQGHGNLNLNNLSTSQGFVIESNAANDGHGQIISSAGDVNGDGFDDIIMGAPFGAGRGGLSGDPYSAGEAYVVFGSQTVTGDLNLSSLTPNQGFVIQGSRADDTVGYSVSGAGDVNGDGFDDMVVSAPLFTLDPNRIEDSKSITHVLFGTDQGFGVRSNGQRIVNADEITFDKGFSIVDEFDSGRIYTQENGSGSERTEVGGITGWSVSDAGDFNGDGFDDLVLSSVKDYDSDMSNEAYIVFGTDGLFGVKDKGQQTLNLYNADSHEALKIFGSSPDSSLDFFETDEFGATVSSAGDINGDGYDDVLISASRNDDGGTDAGETYVIYGRATSIDLGLQANDDFATATSGTPVVVDVLANDIDPDDNVFIFDVSGVDNGSATIDPLDAEFLTFTPDEGFIGTETFEYQVEDENGDRSSATITVEVSEML